MKITPAIIIGAGTVAGPAAQALMAEIHRLYGAEPWRKLVHALIIDDDGALTHLPPPGAEPLFKGKTLAGVQPAMTPPQLFAVMAGKNRAPLGDEILAELRHHLHQTDLAKEMNRHGHELDQGLLVFILSPAFDAAGGAATMAVLLALSRLHATGIVPELCRTRILTLMPDLFPERDNEQGWARTHEYFRELQALAIDARLMTETDRDLDVDLGVTVLSRTLGSGLAIPDWHGYLLPLAELVSHQAQNLLTLKPAERKEIEGKPAFLSAFGFFRFFYPRHEVDLFLGKLVRNRWYRRFIAGAADEAELAGALSLLGEATGLSRSLEDALEKEAQLSGRDQTPMPPPQSVTRALGPSAEQEVTQLFSGLRTRYDELAHGLIAAQAGAVAQAQVRVAARVTAEFDALVEKLFARPVEVGGEERLSLAAAPAMIRLLLDQSADSGIGAWERPCLATREKLLGAARDREELEAAESRVRDAIRAGETGRRDRDAVNESLNIAREKRLQELAELKAKLEPKKIPEPAKTSTPGTAITAPSAAAPPAPGASLVDQLYGNRGPSLTEVLWGTKTDQPKTATGIKKEATDADPATTSRIELLARPSSEELELESRGRTIQAQLDRIEREMPLLESKAQTMRAKLDESRKLFLDEALHNRRLAEIERGKLEKITALESEAKSILRERAEREEVAKSQAIAAKKPSRPASSAPNLALLLVAGALGLVGTLNLGLGLFDSIGSGIGLTGFTGRAILSLIPMAAAAFIAVLGLRRPAPPALSAAPPQPTPVTPTADDGPRISALLAQASQSLDELLDLRYQVNRNYQALNVFARLRTHAQSVLVGLGEFKTFFETDAPPPARLTVDESPWEISLAPADLGAHLDRQYGKPLRDAIRDDTSPANVWRIYRDFEQSAEKPALEARVSAVLDRVFHHERTEMTMAERLVERLAEPGFREFFGNLLSGLGVSARVNEEIACPSAVRKTNYLALHAPDAIRDKVMAEVARLSGLQLSRVDSPSPAEMSIFLSWNNFAAFQLAQLMKARDALSRLRPPGIDNPVSLLPEPDSRRLPDLYPLVEILPAETLALRELALALIALGLITTDWQERSFVVDFPEGRHADLHSVAEVMGYLASTEGEPTRVFGGHILSAILSGEDRGPETEDRVARALAWIDEACRQYDRRETIFHALEDEDYRVILSLPEKFIRV